MGQGGAGHKSGSRGKSRGKKTWGGAKTKIKWREIGRQRDRRKTNGGTTQGTHLERRKKRPGQGGKGPPTTAGTELSSSTSAHSGLPWPQPDLALARTVTATTSLCTPAVGKPHAQQMGTSPRPLSRSHLLRLGELHSTTTEKTKPK